VIPEIQISEYNYSLPEERIARYPLEKRDMSNLLVYNRGNISHLPFSELPSLLSPDLLMLFNDTRVVQARLQFEKKSGSRIEIFCLEPHDPPEYNLAFQKEGSCIWKCLVGNARKWKKESLVKELINDQGSVRLVATQAGRDKDAFLIRFSWEPAGMDFGTVLEYAGTTPIPPYLNREAVPADKLSYQTVYSQIEGSVAAPTAGLHFTDDVLQGITDQGISRISLTLHVGAGTFQPVGHGGLEKHPMHAERFFVPSAAIEKLADHYGDVLAVGTTTTRIIESMYWLGCKIHSEGIAAAGEYDRENVLLLDQWEDYHLKTIPHKQSLECLLDYVKSSGKEFLEAVTRLMIIPGYSFRMTDRIITNFHQPGSTLLLLVGAFIGEDWKRVYSYARENDFRFLSYGDSSILTPGNPRKRS
jgi:S-adenosylmethionine:tRNA ribosyltransferase-isomerase